MKSIIAPPPTGSSSAQKLADAGVGLAAVADCYDEDLDLGAVDAVDDAPVAGAPGIEALERELEGPKAVRVLARDVDRRARFVFASDRP